MSQENYISTKSQTPTTKEVLQYTFTLNHKLFSPAAAVTMPASNAPGPVASAAAPNASPQAAPAATRHDSNNRHRHHHHSSQTSSAKASYASGPTIVGGHFKVGKKIGEGSFGIIYEGIPPSTACGCTSSGLLTHLLNFIRR